MDLAVYSGLWNLPYTAVYKNCDQTIAAAVTTVS